MPGPAPNPRARRRNARPDWRRLPSTGRPGDPPTWPMGRKPSRATWALWCELWATPQAVAWADLGWTRVVARYTRKLLKAEQDSAPVSLQAEVRQMEDRLGLTPMAMRRLQWEIDDRARAQLDGGGGAEVTELDDYRGLYGS